MTILFLDDKDALYEKVTFSTFNLCLISFNDRRQRPEIRNYYYAEKMTWLVSNIILHFHGLKKYFKNVNI